MRSSQQAEKTVEAWRTISMDASSVLWANWQEQLKELLPGIHGHQKKTLALFVLGIVLSGCAVMQRVAETLSERGMSEAKMTSIERRLARFIANERLVVPLIWKLFLAQVLAPFRGQKLYFVLDNHCRSRINRDGASQALPGSRLALSVARLSGAYLSALFQRQIGAVVEAF